MSIAQTNVIAKIAAVVAGLGLVAMSFVSAVPAKADTTSDLQAQIAALQAQLAALSAGASASASATFTTDLTIGSKGAEVSALQTWLIGKGFSIPAGATGYFGAQTKAAVAAWQASAGITPAAGYFGPKSRAAANASAGNGSGQGTVGVGELKGGEGSLDNFSDYGDVETSLEEGDSNQKVVGLEFEAKDSDLAIQRVDVDFAINGNGSTRLNKYVDSVSLYLDGKKLATADASDADRDGATSTIRFSGLKGIVREGDTADLYVTVDAVNTIGSDEDGDDVYVTLGADSVRAVDAAGISDTYPTDADTAANTFTVSTQTGGDAAISTGSDNPDDSQVQADDTDTTTGVSLLAFKVKATNQDITINDVPVQIAGTSAGAGEIVQTLKLMKGSKVLKSKSIASSTTAVQNVVFSDVNVDVSKDDTAEFSVVADVRKLDGGFGAGDELVASTTSNLAWDIEDQNGDSVDPTGSAVGGTVTFSDTGVTVTKVTTTASKTAGSTASSTDYTQYAVTFKVTAGDDDLYIDRSTQRTSSPSTAGAGVAWATTTSSSSGKTDMGTANLTAEGTNSGDTTNVYKVDAGTSREFTLNVTLTETYGQTGYTGIVLTGVNYTTDSTDTTPDDYYTAGLDTIKTSDVLMTYVQ
ncbi:MAG: peptidoglycan-binding domain-containing protein [Bacillota bacterium]